MPPAAHPGVTRTGPPVAARADRKPGHATQADDGPSPVTHEKPKTQMGQIGISSAITPLSSPSCAMAQPRAMAQLMREVGDNLQPALRFYFDDGVRWPRWADFDAARDIGYPHEWP